MWDIVLIELSDILRHSPGWAAPFPRQEYLNCRRIGKYSWAQASKQAHTPALLLFPLDCGCHVNNYLKLLLLTSLKWWTVTWNWELKSTCSPPNCNRNETRNYILYSQRPGVGGKPMPARSSFNMLRCGGKTQTVSYPGFREPWWRLSDAQFVTSITHSKSSGCCWFHQADEFFTGEALSFSASLSMKMSHMFYLIFRFLSSDPPMPIPLVWVLDSVF